jgi:hypothetical protein
MPATTPGFAMIVPNHRVQNGATTGVFTRPHDDRGIAGRDEMAANSHAGRASSWLAVIVIWIGFGVGGAALVPHPKWVLFWVGVGIVAVGGIIAAAVNIFDDVVMDGPRVLPEKLHHSELKGKTAPHVELGERASATDPATTRPHG